MKNQILRGALLGGLCSLVVLLVACTAGNASVLDQIVLVVVGLLPVAGAIAGGLLPAESALIQSVQLGAVAALKVASKELEAYEANPTENAFTGLQKTFADANAQLQVLLKAAQVKNPDSAARITAIVEGAIQGLTLLEASIGAKHADPIIKKVL